MIEDNRSHPATYPIALSVALCILLASCNANKKFGHRLVQEGHVEVGADTTYTIPFCSDLFAYEMNVTEKKEMLNLSPSDTSILCPEPFHRGLPPDPPPVCKPPGKYLAVDLPHSIHSIVVIATDKESGVESRYDVGNRWDVIELPGDITRYHIRVTGESIQGRKIDWRSR